MRKNAYIGLFRTFPRGRWEVTFPDLPGCEARGRTFKEVFGASREALAEYLSELGDPLPRPRSTAELLIDAQRDWLLAQELAHSVMHPVEPAARDDLAPLELVALQSRSGGSYPPQFGA